MLTIEYDPSGIHIPDATAMTLAESLIDLYKTTKNVLQSEGRTHDRFFAAANFIFIDAMRVLVLRGVISHEEVLFHFKGENIRIDKYGNLEKWPKGFGDILDEFLMELILAEK